MTDLLSCLSFCTGPSHRRFGPSNHLISQAHIEYVSRLNLLTICFRIPCSVLWVRGPSCFDAHKLHQARRVHPLDGRLAACKPDQEVGSWQNTASICFTRDFLPNSQQNTFFLPDFKSTAFRHMENGIPEILTLKPSRKRNYDIIYVALLFMMHPGGLADQMVCNVALRWPKHCWHRLS